MAVSAPTSLTTLGNATVAASNTTASISPSAGALLVVCCSTAGTSQASLSIVDTFVGTGAWSSVNIQTGTKTSYIFTAKAGPSPGTGTVKITASVNQNRWMIVVSQVTGQDPTTPVGSNTITGSSTTSTLSLTLPSPPAATSCVVGTVGVYGQTTYTKGASYTDLTGVASSTFAVTDEEYSLGAGAGTTVDWSALGTTLNVGCAIEIVAPAATQVPYMPYGRQPFLAT